MVARTPLLLRLLFVAGLFAALVIGRRGGAATISREALVKAAFVYKFLLFTEFPEEAPSGDPGPHAICILGSSAFDGAFGPVEDKKVRGRPLVIRRIPRGAGRRETAGCSILFVGKGNGVPETRRALSLTRGRAVLTVGEHVRFLSWGGMIRLFRDSGKVAFEVNSRSARREGISFRAQMLRIAKRVLE